MDTFLHRTTLAVGAVRAYPVRRRGLPLAGIVAGADAVEELVACTTAKTRSTVSVQGPAARLTRTNADAAAGAPARAAAVAAAALRSGRLLPVVHHCCWCRW